MGPGQSGSHGVIALHHARTRFEQEPAIVIIPSRNGVVITAAPPTQNLNNVTYLNAQVNLKTTNKHEL